MCQDPEAREKFVHSKHEKECLISGCLEQKGEGEGSSSAGRFLKAAE